MSDQARLAWDAINKGQYSKAWDIVEKVLKSNSSHPYWISVAAYIRMNQGKRNECLRLAQSVLDMKPSTGQIIAILSDIYVEYRLPAQVFQLYDQALKKKSSGGGNDEIIEIADQWAQTCISLDHYKGLNRAGVCASQKTRTSDESRRYIYQAVMGTCLAIKWHQFAGNDNERKIAAMVALRTLDKVPAADNVNEMYVRALALKYGSTTDKLIEYLTGEDVRKQQCLDLTVMTVYEMRDAKRWSELCEFCEACLTKENSLDSWLYWEWLVKSGVETSQTDRVKAILQSQAGNSRNILLARCLLSDLTNQDELLPSIYAYLEIYGHKRCAFEDLHIYISRDGFPLNTLIDWFSTKNKNNFDWELTLRKFQSLLSPGLLNLSELISLYVKSVDSVKDHKDSKDYHGGDDFVILAVEKLLSGADIKTDDLIKSAILLEEVAKWDKHQFYIRLWLVQIYRAIGANSLAMMHYNTLSIKSAQNEGLAHLVVTRCSMVSPHANTLRDIENMYKFYDQIHHVTHFTRHAYAKGQYIQLEGFHELHYKLENSLTKRILELERVKIMRLLGKEPSTRFCEADYELKYGDIQDNRDFKTWRGPLGNKSLGCGVEPNVSKEWVRAFTLRELLIRRIGGEENTSGIEAELDDLLINHADKFTASERSSLLAVLGLSRQQYDALVRDLQLGFTTVTGAHYSGIDGAASFLCDSFTMLETCVILQGALARSKHQTSSEKSRIIKIISSQSENIKTAAQQLWSQVREAKTNVYNEWASSLGLSSDIAEMTLSSIVKSLSEGGLQHLKNRK